MRASFILALLSFSLCANAGRDTLCIALTGHYGFVMPHSASMSYIIKAHMPALELNVFRRTKGDSEWERSFKYPEKGFSLFYIDLKNPGVTGRGFAIDPYVNHPLFQRQKFRLNFKTGVGIGYLTEIFDRTENHKNVTIGSHFNAFVDLRLSAALQWAGAFRTDVGLGFAHFSNGAYTMPNLGYNFISVNLGCVWTKYPIAKNMAEVAPADRKIQFWLIGLGGVNEAMPPGGKKYFPHSISANFYQPLGHVSTLTLGVEVVNNPARMKRLARVNDTISYGQNFQAGIKLGHELTMGRTALVVEIGAYFYDPHPITGLFFHRIGVHYKVNDRLMGILSLRTHWARADNFEAGIGYRISRQVDK